MMKLESGAIVLVNFPFTDLQSPKVRPALVLTVKGEDVIIVGIFSRAPPPSFHKLLPPAPKIELIY